MDFFSQDDMSSSKLRGLLNSMQVGFGSDLYTLEYLYLPVYLVLGRRRSDGMHSHFMVSTNDPDSPEQNDLVFIDRQNAERALINNIQDNEEYFHYVREMTLLEYLVEIDAFHREMSLGIVFNTGDMHFHFDAGDFVKYLKEIAQREALAELFDLIRRLKANVDIDVVDPIAIHANLLCIGTVENLDDGGVRFIVKTFECEDRPIYAGCDNKWCFKTSGEDLEPAPNGFNFHFVSLAFVLEHTRTLESHGFEIEHRGKKVFLNEKDLRILAQIFVDLIEVKIDGQSIRNISSPDLSPEEMLEIENLVSQQLWIEDFRVRRGTNKNGEVHILSITPKLKDGNTFLELARFRQKLENLSIPCLANLEESKVDLLDGKYVMKPSPHGDATLTSSFQLDIGALHIVGN